MDDVTGSPPLSKRDWSAIALLVVLSGLIHVWLLAHTEVPARDCIGFVRYAWRLEHHPWPEVMRTSEVHPGYPVAIHLAKPLVAWFYHEKDPLLMERSAQLVSSVFGLLLILPMYFLGRELFSGRIGFWGALLFQCLPAAGRALSDGLSEATFFFFFAMAAWQAVRGLRTGQIGAFALCGSFGALAYLTRPEGLLIVLATVLAMALGFAVRLWPQPWKRGLACTSVLVGCAIVVGCPIYFVTGKFSPKPAVNDVVGAAHSPLRTVGPLLAVTGTEKSNRQGMVLALTESMRAFNYAGWVPMLLGVWWNRGRIARGPGHWVTLAAAGGICYLMWRVASIEGYLSDRHTLVLVFFGIFWMVAGLELLPGKLSALLVWFRWNRMATWCKAAHAPIVLLALSAALCLPRTLQRLHYNRGGFREAGIWLAEHSTYADEILDPYCWSHYYAGRVFIEGQDTSGEIDEAHVPVTYVVLEEEAKSPHPNLPEVTKAKEKVQQPHAEVYRWKGYRGKDYAEVAVYRIGD